MLKYKKKTNYKSEDSKNKNKKKQCDSDISLQRWADTTNRTFYTNKNKWKINITLKILAVLQM